MCIRRYVCLTSGAEGCIKCASHGTSSSLAHEGLSAFYLHFHSTSPPHPVCLCMPRAFVCTERKGCSANVAGWQMHHAFYLTPLLAGSIGQSKWKRRRCGCGSLETSNRQGNESSWKIKSSLLRIWLLQREIKSSLSFRDCKVRFFNANSIQPNKPKVKFSALHPKGHTFLSKDATGVTDYLDLSLQTTVWNASLE